MTGAEIRMRRYDGGAIPELAPTEHAVASVVLDGAALKFLIDVLPESDAFRGYLVDLRETARENEWRRAA